MSQALGRLMMVTEKYPTEGDAPSSTQTQLEGTENRITVARGRYISLVQDFNTYIRSFPQNLVAMVFGYKVKPNFAVENEAQIQQAPNVDFGAPPAVRVPAPQQLPESSTPGGVPPARSNNELVPRPSE